MLIAELVRLNKNLNIDLAVASIGQTKEKVKSAEHDLIRNLTKGEKR